MKYLLLVSLLLAACGTFQLPEIPKDVSDVTFKHDLVIEINGKKYTGVGVVPRSSSYHIKVYPDERISRIFWNSCHQGNEVDQPNTGWFKKTYEFDLKEVPGVQDVYACALEVTVMNMEKRKNGFAVLEFLDSRPEVNLKALVKCNGSLEYYENGVSICQSAAGLIQQIKFSEPVIHAGSMGNCADVMKAADDKTFTYIMPKGKCTYYFGADRKLNGKTVLHRLQTVGYTEAPLK